MEWSVYVMNMTPIKKFIIGLAAAAIAVSIITANNLSSIILLYASRQASAPAVQSQQTGGNAATQQSGSSSTGSGSTSSSGSSSSSSSSSSANTSTNAGSTNTGNAGSTSTDKTDSANKDDAQNNADAKPEENKDNAGAAAGMPSTTAEVVDYFNKAINNVKPNAKSVDQKYVTNYLAGAAVISSGISSIYNMLGGDDWLDGMLQDNSQGEAKYEGADITAKFPVEGESWSSQLTADDVTSATCTDNNGIYTITIVTKADAKSDNVQHGQGHAPKAFNVVLPSVVNDNIPGIAAKLVGTATMDYPESTVTVTVDSATGKVLTADYDLKWTINFDAMGIILPLGTKSSYVINY